MELDSQLAEGQAEACATAAPPGALVEAIEDVRGVGRVDPRSGVAHADDDGSLEGAIARDFDADFAPARRVLHGVREQVGQHAHDETVIDEDVRILRESALHLDTLRERFGCDLRRAALGERGERDGLWHRLELAFFHLVDIEESVDHPQKLADVRLRESQQLVELLTAGFELSHPDELHERHDAVREIADVVAEHANELFAGLLHALEVARRLPQFILESLREDRAAHSSGELDGLEWLREVIDAA